MGVVEHMMEGGTMIVPGHGRLTDSADVAYYRDMMTILRDRVQAMIKKGTTLEQVKAAKLTRDYDPRFGRNPPGRPTCSSRRSTRPSLEGAVGHAHAPVPDLCARPLPRCVRCARGAAGPAGRARAPGGRGGPAADAARGADRPHRLLGVGRHRGLALSHADAAQGQRRHVPLNAEARRVIDDWDPAKDEAAGSSAAPTAPAA